MQISKGGFGTIAPVQWSSPTQSLPMLRLFGLQVANASREAALDWLSTRIERGERTRVAFLNAHCVNVAARDANYRKALTTTDALLPDGSGIALATRMQRSRLVANLNGTDLVPALCERLARSGHSVFLFGGEVGVAADAGRALQAQYPGLKIAGTQHGFFNKTDEQLVINKINASGASLLLVAMGVPRQDAWLAQHADELSPTMTMGVGALLDFMAGRVSRAPLALRKIGQEWIWRLAQEPKRMFKRYVLGNPAFIARAVVDALPIDEDHIASFDAAAKRGFDLAITSCALLLLSPLLLLVAALVKATSPGAVLHEQIMIGQDGVPFGMLTFRVTEGSADNSHFTLIGELLCKTGLEELPQLWNVLRGDMSLIGPRPQLPSEVARYLPQQYRQLAAKPGLTNL